MFINLIFMAHEWVHDLLCSQLLKYNQKQKTQSEKIIKMAPGDSVELFI